METKRTKLWRKKQGFRVFKARMIYYASFETYYRLFDGSYHIPQHWFELAKDPWSHPFRSTGTPCSCMLCRGDKKYNRLKYKRDTSRILQESME